MLEQTGARLSGSELRRDLSLDEKMFEISVTLLQPSTTLEDVAEVLEDLETFLTCFQNSCVLEDEREAARFSQ